PFSTLHKKYQKRLSCQPNHGIMRMARWTLESLASGQLILKGKSGSPCGARESGKEPTELAQMLRKGKKALSGKVWNNPRQPGARAHGRANGKSPGAPAASAKTQSHSMFGLGGRSSWGCTHRVGDGTASVLRKTQSHSMFGPARKLGWPWRLQR